MDLSVSVLEKTLNNRTTPTRLIIHVENDELISDVKMKIATRLNNVDVSQIRIVFAGKSLDDDVMLNTAQIDTGTIIHALISLGQQSTHHHQIESDDKRRTDDERELWRPRFFVFCKQHCDSVQAGKLRVRCNQCKSTAVVLQAEPTCWNDVLASRHLACTCPQCASSECYAEFFFKCGRCSEPASPLPQIKANGDMVGCSICDDVLNPVFSFLCFPAPHVLCLDCFKSHAAISLDERRFVLHRSYGYTVACPVFACYQYVTDPHHFRILGVDLYRKFQQLATEMCVLSDGGVFCPRPDCGCGFIPADSFSTDSLRLLICPDCRRVFCRSCTNSASECCCVDGEHSGGTRQYLYPREEHGSPNAKSMSAIQKICRHCPKCNVSTERNGGCHHMSCTQCGMQWCWVCVKEWSDECQWEHWFEC